MSAGDIFTTDADNRIAELKRWLQEVHAEKKELAAQLAEVEAQLAELREAARDIVNYISTRSRGRENHYGGRLLKQTDKLAALLQEVEV